MNTADIVILLFVAFIALSLIYNRLLKSKKAKAKGLSPTCYGCSHSNHCPKALDQTKAAACLEHKPSCCSH